MTVDAGGAAEILPGVRRVLAPNPGPMTGRGTNSYLVGRTDVVAIDPGPAERGHLERLLALSSGRLRYVVVTHAHADHAPGATWLAREAGATLLAFGARGGFVPDGELAEGDVVQVPGHALEALHTPGHSSDHLCYVLSGEGVAPGGVLFSGDHVMGGSTVVISPPDGDMAAYLASLRRLLERDPPLGAIAPGHGEVLHDPRQVLLDYLAHRAEREATVIGLLSDEPVGPRDLVRTIYPDLAPELVDAAARQLWAHLRKLADDGVASGSDRDDPAGTWRLVAAGT